MAVRSRTFILSSSVPSGATGATYTVPSGRTAIVKFVAAHSTSGAGTTTVVVSIEPAAGGISRLINDALGVDECKRFIDLYAVAQPGDVIRARRGTGTMSIQVQGTLLFGAPE